MHYFVCRSLCDIHIERLHIYRCKLIIIDGIFKILSHQFKVIVNCSIFTSITLYIMIK